MLPSSHRIATDLLREIRMSLPLMGVTPCVSMGTFSPKTLRRWKKIQTEGKRSV